MNAVVGFVDVLPGKRLEVPVDGNILVPVDGNILPVVPVAGAPIPGKSELVPKDDHNRCEM